ncbi:GtrA family protein [Secundilactobacillus hailunensis]|uniref:GtrA family protein n=1 Tax=Secundilactobacillus hailunensis TaxID=2559923 RepID=A0ABW1T9N0_9LACO|nr:GtrA family protein [Secundilactobacillus hailunensis]
MAKTLKKLSAKYGEVLRYLSVGGLTTLINVIILFSLTQIDIPWFLANVIAWFSSMLFAFVTNKRFSAGTTETAPKIIFKEGLSFLALRGASLLVNTGVLFTTGLTLPHGSYGPKQANIA